MKRASLSATLLGLAAGLAVAACASRGKQAAAPASEARAPIATGFDRDKGEISRLSAQIKDWRLEMGLRSEPDDELIPSARIRPVSELRICPEHPEPETETCRDTCNIADAICSNADEICRIADQLGGDPWAREKCESAKASCKEATEKCCTCTNGEDEAADMDAAEEPSED